MYKRGLNGVLLAGVCLFWFAHAAQEADSRRSSKAMSNMPGGGGVQELQAQLKKELGQINYSQATVIDLSKIDSLLEAGAGLNFEECMVADIFAITQAEDALVSDGFILRGLTGQDRVQALANSKLVKRRLFFGALLCRCRVLNRVLDSVFKLLAPSYYYGHIHNPVYRIIVGYTDNIFLVLQRFLITAPEAVHEDVGGLKILFARERDIALGACDTIAKPVGWQDPAGRGLIQESARDFGLECVSESQERLAKRHTRILQVVDSGSLAEFVSCFESAY
jgi:hypothetical protein